MDDTAVPVPVHAILRHTAAFIDEVLARADLRHRILSLACLEPALLRASTLISQSLENSPVAEKLILALPEPTPLSSLLLSLARGYRGRQVSAGLALLDVFSLDPFLARTELAQPVFQNLFVPHLLPALERFAERRSRISSSHGSKGWNKKAYERMLSCEPMTLLSRMSGAQAEELKELERGLEDTMDENCWIYAEYLKRVLKGSDSPCPDLIFVGTEGEPKGLGESKDEEKIEFEPYNNPMWAEAEEDQSADFSSPHSSQEHLYPQRVQPHVLAKAATNASRSVPNAASSLAPTRTYYKQSNEFSRERDDELEDLKFEKQSSESSCSSIAAMGESGFLTSSKHNPPKDFVCPITGTVFDDPVTLETGQTYERVAIREWVGRGNSTCPITRQQLSSTQLPKTNYVLKRLIASWQERNPGSTPAHAASESPSPPPKLLRTPSPTSVISQASIDSKIGDLRLAITNLCTSDILTESEMAVLLIFRYWRETDKEREVLSALSKPAVINGFVEVLFNSVDPQVLATAVYMLSEMASKDPAVVQTLTRVDSDVECMVALFKNGVVEAVVLIYLLNPSWESLIEMNMVEDLITTIKRRGDNAFGMCLKPKTASILLLQQIMRGDSTTASEVCGAVISGNTIQTIVRSLEAESVEERAAAVGILLRCIEEDGNCRNEIAGKAEVSPVLECFHLVDEPEKYEIVLFLNELVKLRRRSFSEQMLRTIKNGGGYSTMHSLLVYLQTVLHDQAPIVCSLLLQLDLLVEPRKMSMYREEAIDTLISCLRDSNCPNGQVAAAETILSLQGRFSDSGKPLVRALLLKHAGMDRGFRAIMRSEQSAYPLKDSEENLEEDKASDEWERRVAFVLVSHEFGLIFEALADGMKSKNTSLFSACLVSATWLVHMLSVLPNTGVRGAARHCLLKQYVSILKSSKNLDDKALAMLAVRSFMNDAEGMKDTTFYIKDILRTIRALKKSSIIAYEILKNLSDTNESSSDMWNHRDLNHVDCSTNGEVLSIVYFSNIIFSGHSDGTIKVWEGGDRILDLIQESREHTKAVTSLAILHSGEKLYSGSLDKTVRVWTVRDKSIFCAEVHDMKDQVHNLTVANTVACFIPQGAGVKIASWNGGSKLYNPSKNVECLALVHGKIYCGCRDNSIQEIDLATGTLATVQAGNKKLLGKSNPVYALQVHDGSIYSVSSSVDGTTIKIHNASNYIPTGVLTTNSFVRTMAISTDLIYLGCKSGCVDVWSRDKLSKVATLQAKTNSKVVSMSLDDDGDVLVVGTSDGRLQAWGLT